LKLQEALSTFRGHRVPNMDLIDRKRWWFAFSGVLIALSLVGLVARGLNYSISFTGGSSLQFPNRSGASDADYQAILARFGLHDSTIEFIGANQVSIRTASLTTLGATPSPTPSVSPTGSASAGPSSTPSAGASATSSAGPTASASATPSASAGATPTAGATSPPAGALPPAKSDLLRGALARAAGISTNQINEQDVGPTWGGTISRKAITGLIVFLVLVTIYITARFELKMAGAALVALAHDLIITTGVYALVGRQVTPETVIAVLTILGYSLYDTVVIFDKVKENTESAALIARDTYSGVVNMSVNQTFMRSVNTSLVVLLPIGALLLFGGTTLKDFAFALFVGVTSGAYSSIFIAAPTLALLKEREPRYQQVRARAQARAARPGLRAAPATVPSGSGRSSSLGAAQDGGAGTSRARTGTVAAARPGGGTKKKKGKPQGKPKRRRR
jgi:preprotein translocase subunit SecF